MINMNTLFIMTALQICAHFGDFGDLIGQNLPRSKKFRASSFRSSLKNLASYFFHLVLKIFMQFLVFFKVLLNKKLFASI